MPRMALVTVTPARLGLSVSVNVAVVAMFVAFVFTKFAVPATTELTGALAGKLAKLALMSAALPVTLNVAVLLAALVSLSAPVVPVPSTPVLVWMKLIDALTVPLAGTLTTPAGVKVTMPVAGA